MVKRERYVYSLSDSHILGYDKIIGGIIVYHDIFVALLYVE